MTSIASDKEDQPAAATLPVVVESTVTLTVPGTAPGTAPARCVSPAIPASSSSTMAASEKETTETRVYLEQQPHPESTDTVSSSVGHKCLEEKSKQDLSLEVVVSPSAVDGASSELEEQDELLPSNNINNSNITKPDTSNTETIATTATDNATTTTTTTHAPETTSSSVVSKEDEQQQQQQQQHSLESTDTTTNTSPAPVSLSDPPLPLDHITAPSLAPEKQEQEQNRQLPKTPVRKVTTPRKGPLVYTPSQQQSSPTTTTTAASSSCGTPVGVTIAYRQKKQEEDGGGAGAGGGFSVLTERMLHQQSQQRLEPETSSSPHTNSPSTSPPAASVNVPRRRRSTPCSFSSSTSTSFVASSASSLPRGATAASSSAFSYYAAHQQQEQEQSSSPSSSSCLPPGVAQSSSSFTLSYAAQQAAAAAASTTTTASASTVTSPRFYKKQKKPVPSWRVFLEVAVLYLACLILPNVMGSLYQRGMQMQESAATVLAMMKESWNGISSNFSCTRAAAIQEQDAVDHHHDWKHDHFYYLYYYYSSLAYPYISASNVLAKSYYNAHVKSYACSVDPSYYSPTLGSYYAYYLGCAVEDDTPASLFSTDTSPAQDLQLVAILSLCMALVRSLIVAVYVVGGGGGGGVGTGGTSGAGGTAAGGTRRDDSDPKFSSSSRVEAMVRCKSIGLLSVDYYTPLTPSSSGSRLLQEEDEQPQQQQATATTTTSAIASSASNTNATRTAASSPPPPVRQNYDHQNDDDQHDYSYSHLGLGLDDSSHHPDEDDADMYDFTGWGSPLHPSAVAAAAATAAAALIPDPVTTTTTTSSFDVPALPRMTKEENNNSNNVYYNNNNCNCASLYAAPRYATALFRLMYSLTASVLAYVWFHRASFWPWYVGGSGTTAACWDLSGGLTLGMDSDFDHRNLVLKRYFLLQASYHWQSIAFHILSMVMLIWDFRRQQQQPQQQQNQQQQQYQRREGSNVELTATTTDRAASNRPAAPRRRGFWSVARKTTRSYSRSLLQHLLALLLIAVAYIFSSLRRLGAIGMFAGDVSSCFMHLLQLVLNKSTSSHARSSSASSTTSTSSSSVDYSRCIFWLYYVGVLPSFVVMRLCIWPRLWYSATVESHSWFQQMERTLFPNSALVLKGILHVWMLLVTYLTVVGLKRLHRHPHLQRSLRRETVK